MDFKILDVFTRDGHLVVSAQHYHVDGAEWFQENYTWQGREGLKHKRRLNAAGDFLLVGGGVAPRHPNGTPVLPEGQAWERHVSPHLDDDALLGVIKGIHRQRVASGWPDGGDILFSRPYSDADTAGSPALLYKFRRFAGSQHDG